MIEAYVWYESKQTNLGERFLSALEDCYQSLDINPNTYAKKYKQQRQAIVKGFPFVIMYEQMNTVIVIYAIFNTHQEPSKKLR
ncbi:MAG: type II toxin-antitoxin system RelE/ParE family toxin [Flavobacteriales bacterium]|nr:type II toxin-antitoxin system RelE/ParE family toxin [Flavobacteriales bacterium]